LNNFAKAGDFFLGSGKSAVMLYMYILLYHVPHIFSTQESSIQFTCHINTGNIHILPLLGYYFENIYVCFCITAVEKNNQKLSSEICIKLGRVVRKVVALVFIEMFTAFGTKGNIPISTVYII